MVALLHCTQYDFYNATIHDVDFDDDGVTSHDHGPKTMTGKKQQYAFVCPLYAYIYIYLMLFCQDRLGTSIGKTHEKSTSTRS